MKVLQSSVACTPYGFSESHFGWMAPAAMCRDHEVWVMVHSNYRSDIERGRSEGIVPPNLHFHFFGRARRPHPNLFVARLESWREYVSWMKELWPEVRVLHRRIGFDVAHHVCYSTWRVACPLWKLDIPFVWGPIGGAEVFPWRFLGMLERKTKAFEIARGISNLWSTFDPAVRTTARRAACVIASNRETERQVIRLRGSSQGVERLSAAFFDDRRIERFSFKASLKARPMGERLKIFAGGSMEGRKGIVIALRALALAKQKGLRFTYRFAGQGVESAHLRKVASDLGLADEIVFGHSLSGEDYVRELQSSHVYLLPSLRENAGLTLMEAMLAGCVPIVADAGGPGEIVADDCGFKVPVTNIEEMSLQIAEYLILIAHSQNLAVEMGCRASRRIAENYSEGHYRLIMSQLFAKIKAEVSS